MDYDIHAALAAGVSPTDIVSELATRPDAVPYDVQGALKAGVKPDEIVHEIASKTPQDLAGRVIGPQAAGAISSAIHAVIPGSIQRGRAHMLEGMANTADVLGAPGPAGYLHRQVDKEQLDAPSSQEALGKAFNEGSVGGVVRNIPGAIGEAVPQIVGAAGGAALGTAIAPGVGTAGGLMAGAGADALLGVVTQAGDIAKARAKADGREVPNNEDIAVAVGSSAVIGALNRVGLGEAAGSLVANGVKSLLGRQAAGRVATAIGSGVAHGAADAAGAVGQQLAETAGTQQGATVDPGAIAAQAVTGMGVRGALGAGRAVMGELTGAGPAQRAEGRQEALRQQWEALSPEEQQGAQNVAAARRDLLETRDATTENPVKPSANVAARTEAGESARIANQMVDTLSKGDAAILGPDEAKQIKGLISDARNTQRSIDPTKVRDTLDGIEALSPDSRQALGDMISQIDMKSTAGVANRNTSVLGKVMGTGAALVGASTPHPFLGSQLGYNVGQRMGDAISRKFGWSDPALVKEGAKAAAMLEAAGVAIPETKAGMVDAIGQSQDAIKAQAKLMGLTGEDYGWSKGERLAVAKTAAAEPAPDPSSARVVNDNLTAIQDRTAANAEVAKQATAQTAPQEPAQAPVEPPAVTVARNRSTASSEAPSASADLSQLLPSRQPPQGFKSMVGERLPDWVYAAAHDVHEDLHLSGTPKTLNYAQEVAKAVSQLQHDGLWDAKFSRALLDHKGRVTEGVFVAVRNQMLANHGTDRRSLGAQGSSQGPFEFSGSMDLLHGQSASIRDGHLKSFKPVGDVDPSVRYGDSLFGDDAVYLDNTPEGRWAFGDPDRGFGTNRAYEVRANFGKAFVISPETVGRLKSLVGSDDVQSGKNVADHLRAAGYDGIIIRGFDAEAAKRGGTEHEEDVAKHYGLPTDLVQDQVVAFKPENLTVKGPALPHTSHPAYEWYRDLLAHHFRGQSATDTGRQAAE